MKKIKYTLIISLTLIFLQSISFAEVFNAFLSKNSFVPIQPVKTLSTATYEEGDSVYFIVPTDIWLEEYKIIPKNSIVKAKITMLKMPITGVNATMKLEAQSITFPNGEVHTINGGISYRGELQIGGNLTPPLSYNKALHPRKGEYFNGVVAQYVPSGEYEFGQHITIMPSETFYIVLSEDFSPY